MSSESSCLINGGRNSSVRTSNAAVMTIIALLSAIAIVLGIILAASMNRKRNASKVLEPVSERRGFRDSTLDMYEWDESSIHPAWFAASSTLEESQEGRHPLITLIPPALCALNTTNAREKRLNLVRHSLLSSSQRIDWDTFDNWSSKKQMNKSWQKQRARKTGDEWPLWL